MNAIWQVCLFTRGIMTIQAIFLQLRHWFLNKTVITCYFLQNIIKFCNGVSKFSFKIHSKRMVGRIKTGNRIFLSITCLPASFHSLSCMKNDTNYCQILLNVNFFNSTFFVSLQFYTICFVNEQFFCTSLRSQLLTPVLRIGMELPLEVL